RLIVPAANAPEAAVIEGVQVFGVTSLHQAWKFLNGEEEIAPFQLDRQAFFRSQRGYEVDFDEVKGQHHVKRALEVAVAGGHNLLLSGPPVIVMSMLANRLQTIMHDMTQVEAIDATKLHSVTWLLDPKKAIHTTRPSRAPHPTLSDAGLLGGGTSPTPGE